MSSGESTRICVGITEENVYLTKYIAQGKVVCAIVFGGMFICVGLRLIVSLRLFLLHILLHDIFKVSQSFTHRVVIFEAWSSTES